MQKSVESGFHRDTPWQEVIKGIDLSGKLAVITGGSVGLGKETARALLAAGADVILGSRSLPSLEAAKADIASAGKGDIHVVRLDLTSAESIKSFAEAVLALNLPVDILVNNAGVMWTPLQRDARGNEGQLSSNFLGHAMLTSALAPALAAAREGRIVSLTSTGHHFSPVNFDDPNFERDEYDKFVSYGQSKTACSLLAVKAAASLGRYGVRAFAVHPGLIATNLAAHFEAEDRVEVVKRLGKFGDTLPAMKTIEAGCATSVWAATSPLLNDRSFAYLEDCGVATPIDSPNYGSGVLPYAIDEALAGRAWEMAERLVGSPLPLEA